MRQTKHKINSFDGIIFLTYSKTRAKKENKKNWRDWKNKIS